MSATNRGKSERVLNDAYATPSYCITRLLPYLDLSSEEGQLRFLEPCRGEGVIFNALPDAGVFKEWAEVREGRDYLTTEFGKFDLIITNPPYTLAMQFLQKSLREAETVIYLLRLNFLGSVARKEFWETNKPTHIFVITPRPRFVNGQSDACEYGWICFDRGNRILVEEGLHWL